MDDDSFKPKLSSRSLRQKTPRRYLHHIKASINRAGGRSSRKATKQWDKRGRGGPAACDLLNKGTRSKTNERRVVVKARIVKLSEKGFANAKAHTRYIQRENASHGEDKPHLYTATTDRTDGDDFLKNSQDDRHQFRVVLAPEDGLKYDSLKPLTRRLMEQVEKDLGTRLSWIAADHDNNGHPHTHIIIRGIDDQGHDLVISGSYLSHGFRERAAELIRLDLGPPSDHEITKKLSVEMQQNSFTSLDQKLLHLMGNDATLSLPKNPRTLCVLLAGRLQHLKKIGLAQSLTNETWSLSPDLKQSLLKMAEHQEIIKTVNRVPINRGLNINTSIDAVYNPHQPPSILVGRVAVIESSPSHDAPSFLLIEGVDGRTHYVGLDSKTSPALEPGSIVRVKPLLEAEQTQPAQQIQTRRPHAIHIECLSKKLLQTQIQRQGITWLDQVLFAGKQADIAKAGFGATVHAALEQRKAWLISQGLAKTQAGLFECNPEMLHTLAHLNYARVIEKLSARLKLPHAEPFIGDRIEGTLKGCTTVANTKFGIIERANDFIMVPWKDDHREHLGKTILGRLRVDGLFIFKNREKGLGLS